MEHKPTTLELEIQEFYQLACSQQTHDPRTAVALAKQILRRDMSHLGAWQLIYQLLGHAEPVGSFESSFIQYNFATRQAWYQAQRMDKHIGMEQAKLQTRLQNWRKLFDEQNQTTFADKAPGYILLGLSLAVGIGMILVFFSNQLETLFQSISEPEFVVIGGILLVACMVGWGGLFFIRYFEKRHQGQQMAPEAPANVRWSAIEAHFQQMIDQLQRRDDLATPIPDSFSLFINLDLKVCRYCGRAIDSHHCAPITAPRATDLSPKN